MSLKHIAYSCWSLQYGLQYIFLSCDTFVMSCMLDLNKMENGTLGANLVPVNKVTKFEE